MTVTIEAEIYGMPRTTVCAYRNSAIRKMRQDMEPLALFLLDYVAIMGLFVGVGYYISVLLITGKQKNPKGLSH